MTNTGILWTLLVLGLHLRLTHAEAGSSKTVTPANPANPSITIAPSNPANNVTSAPPPTSANPAPPTASANPAPPTTSANPANPTTSANPANPTTSANPAPPTTSANPANPTISANPANPTSANPANPTTSANPAPPTTSANLAPPTTSANPANPTTSANPANPTTSANPAPPTTSANPAPPTTSANPAPPTTSANHANPAPIATSANPAPLAPTANPALSTHPATATNHAITNSPVISVDDKSQSGKQGEGTSKPSLAQSSQSLATSSPSHAASSSASATAMDKSSQNSATKLSDTTDKTAFTNQETSTERISEDYKTTGQSTEGSEKDTRHHSTSLLPKAETNNSNNTFRVTYILQENMEQNQTDILFKVCMKQFKGPGVINCTLGGTIENNHHIFTLATAGGDLSVTQEIYDKIKEEHKEIPTLIIILASCGGLAAMLLAFAVYCTCHRRSYRKNQQHLTEELQTVENGYHDNPTLEVMEVQPEMQEKKLPLNGEFNDSWMVPLDNLTKEDIADEEDTHL